jgi:hypothetical protein
MYIVQSIHIWKRVQDDKKQERQKCPVGTRQTDRKNWGLVWRNRKKISQIIKDYFHLPFFLLIILCYTLTIFRSCLPSSLHRTPLTHGWTKYSIPNPTRLTSPPSMRYHHNKSFLFLTISPSHLPSSLSHHHPNPRNRTN